MSTQVVTPTRREYWTTTDADGVTRTAAVEVGETYFGSQVVVVSLELLRQMLSDLEFAMQAESDYLDAPGQLSGSNRRSVAPKDADRKIKAAETETRCPECIDLSPGVHYPNCQANEKRG